MNIEKNVLEEVQEAKSLLSREHFRALKGLVQQPWRRKVERCEYLMDKHQGIRNNLTPDDFYLRIRHDGGRMLLELVLPSTSVHHATFQEVIGRDEMDTLASVGTLPVCEIQSVLMKVGIKAPFYLLGEMVVTTHTIPRTFPVSHEVILQEVSYPDKSVLYEVHVHCDDELQAHAILNELLETQRIGILPVPERLERLYEISKGLRLF